jgi:hypothetical protein
MVWKQCSKISFPSWVSNPDPLAIQLIAYSLREVSQPTQNIFQKQYAKLIWFSASALAKDSSQVRDTETRESQRFRMPPHGARHAVDPFLIFMESEHLWPTVSRPVCLGVRRPSGTRDQHFFLLEISFRQLRVCYFVAPSLTGGRVCNLHYNCFCALPEQSLLGRSPAELTAIFYCLIWDSPNLEGQIPVFISLRNRVAQLYPRALDSPFVASYDSQSYGGGILTRLHKARFWLYSEQAIWYAFLRLRYKLCL